MVETPKLSSLSGELLRSFVLFSLVLGLVVSVILYFVFNINPYMAVAVAFSLSGIWIIFHLFWIKSKVEELLGRLIYVIDLLEEKHKDKPVVPIPVYREMLDVIAGVKDLINTFEERYEKQIKDMEDQIEVMSENSSKLIDALEKLNDGHLNPEFPEGLDPVGAIGQAFEHTVGIYRSKIVTIKSQLAEIKTVLDNISRIVEHESDKIDILTLKEGIGRLRDAVKEIEEELGFFKDV